VNDDILDLPKLTDTATPDRPLKRRRRPPLRTLAAVLALTLTTIGLALGATVLLWPDEVQETYGHVQLAVGEWRAHAAHEVPSATLGASGGKSVLNRCDGTFTEMTAYERDGVPPVWAAHNDCGGDIVLPLAIGDEIDLVHDGSTERYRIIDIRETPKVWVTTEALIGLKGELALQSCFYGGTDVPMKFLGLERVAATP